jgi:hypothetical protein
MQKLSIVAGFDNGPPTFNLDRMAGLTFGPPAILDAD